MAAASEAALAAALEMAPAEAASEEAPVAAASAMAGVQLPQPLKRITAHLAVAVLVEEAGAVMAARQAAVSRVPLPVR